MADFDRTENGNEKNLATIFISKTELPEQNKTWSVHTKKMEKK